MKRLKLKIIKNLNYDPIVIVDNKLIRLKKNSYGNNIVDITSETGVVNLKIKNYHEVETVTGLVMAMIFYVISLFGIFDIRYGKKFAHINYDGNITLNKDENELTVTIFQMKDGAKALSFKGDCEVDDNESNIYVLDKKLATHLQIFKIFKISFFLLVLISIIIIVII